MSGTESRAVGAPFLELDSVTKQFGEVAALDPITVRMPRNERIALLGPSGCGKSTLLSLIGGLSTPSSGRISLGGDASDRGRLSHCALMPQKDLLLPWRTVIDNASLALQNRGASRTEARTRAMPLLELAGLAEFAGRMPNQLSGGMRQRVSFVRTLLAEKDLLLLDEPFGALDSITKANMHEWLQGVLTTASASLVLVTHDVDEAVYLADRVLVFSRRPGRIVLDLRIELDRTAPRTEIISSTPFIDARNEALEALR